MVLRTRFSWCRSAGYFFDVCFLFGACGGEEEEPNVSFIFMWKGLGYILVSSIIIIILLHTVDGRNPKQPPFGCVVEPLPKNYWDKLENLNW